MRPPRSRAFRRAARGRHPPSVAAGGPGERCRGPRRSAPVGGADHAGPATAPGGELREPAPGEGRQQRVVADHQVEAQHPDQPGLVAQGLGQEAEPDEDGSALPVGAARAPRWSPASTAPTRSPDPARRPRGRRRAVAAGRGARRATASPPTRTGLRPRRRRPARPPRRRGPAGPPRPWCRPRGRPHRGTGRPSRRTRSRAARRRRRRSPARAAARGTSRQARGRRASGDAAWPAGASGMAGPRSAVRGERAEEEGQVGGALGHPAHQVAVPVLAERHVDAHLVAAVGDPGLLGGADAVQHLELVAVR